MDTAKQNFPQHLVISLTKENIETEEFSLLTTNEVPDDADFVLINAPSSDISEEEKNMLENYFDNGGKLLVDGRTGGEWRPSEPL